MLGEIKHCLTIHTVGDPRLLKMNLKTSILLLTLLHLGCGNGDNSEADMGNDSHQEPDLCCVNPFLDMSPDSSADVGPQPDMLADTPPDMPVEPVIEDVFVGLSNGTIHAYGFDAETGALSARSSDTSADHLDFLAFHPTLPVIYSATRSTVRAYSYNPESGDLAFLSSGTTTAAGTHLEVDHSGRYVFTASYGGHSVSMVPLDSNGEPGNSTLTLGGSNDTEFCRNAHQVRVHPSNRFVYIPCLGNDHIRILEFDADAGTLENLNVARIPAGSGPRHMDFHPTSPLAYVINERSSTVTILEVLGSGELSVLETVSAQPAGVMSGSASSDIHVSPDGRHVYAVNRQPTHQVAVFEVDGTTLNFIEVIDGSGEHARSFAIDATGKFLLLANRDGRNVVTFERQNNGRLTQQDVLDLAGAPWFVGFRPRN